MRLTDRQEIALSLGGYGIVALALGAGIWIAMAPLPGSASLALLASERMACGPLAACARSTLRLAEFNK